MTKLSDKQMEYYDSKFMLDELWEIVEGRLSEIFGQKPFRFLDIGGGNGLFSDKILLTFKNASGVLIDNNEKILERNKQNYRKKIVLCNSDEVHKVIGERNFDIVFFNWLLHHLVDRSFIETLSKIRKTLLVSKMMLKDDSLLFVYENCYESYSFHTLPSRLIYYISRNKLLLSITKKKGFHTTGVGVCYLSKEMWEKIFSEVGFEVLLSKNIREHHMKKWKKIAIKMFLHSRKLYYTYFLLTKKNI